MTDAQHNRETIIEAIRVMHDLADCARAISWAAKIAAEKLEETHAGLTNLLAFLPTEEMRK